MTRHRKTVSVDDVTCKYTATRAMLVEIDGDEYWIPYSHVDDSSEVWKQGDFGKLVITEWIADKKGIA